MKKLSAHKCLQQIIACIVFLLFSSGTVSKAQTLTPPWQFDVTVMYNWQYITNINVVNCDMIQCPKYSHPYNTYYDIGAVVWDDNPGTGWNVHMFVQYGAAPGIGSLVIQNASHPDVVIGDDASNPGDKYFITVIYTDESVATRDIRIKRFQVDLTVTPFTVTPLSSVLISNGTDLCEPAHIDLFSNVSSLVGTSPNQTPMLNDYVATWSYFDPFASPSREVVGAIGNINTVTPSQTFSVCTTASTGQQPDVAAYTDANGDKFAAFVYRGHVTEVAEFDLSTSTPSLVGSTHPFTGLTDLIGCRIEAMNQYDGANAKWVAVASDLNTGDIVVKNDLLSSPYFYDCSSALAGVLPPKTITGPYVNPVVAAAMGGYGATNLIGNFQYTTGWFDLAVPNIYSQDVDAATGLPDNSGSYWKVNNSTFTYPKNSKDALMAMANSSNTGWGLLVAWFDGVRIKTKTTSRNPNTYYFKTTSINEQVSANVEVNPNPATDWLRVENADGASYSISDITGRSLLSGWLNTASIIDVAALSPGLYMLQLGDKGRTQTIKFVKE